MITAPLHQLTQLQPTSIWRRFADICAIPHPTFHERLLGDFILQQVNGIGQRYGLIGAMDAKGNIRIQKPASAGMQDHAPVIIQAHYDMVAQKGTASTHDFVHDPITPIIKDGWVWADDTTLGADNGIGLAMALAVAFSDDIAHPPLTLVITSEEETGMGGVKALSSDWLNAPYLINLDSEDEGALFVGCAGGRDATFSHHFDVIDSPLSQQPTLSALRLEVSGLRGGHSGIDIDKGVANANLLLARVLSAVFSESPFYLASLHGGNLRNVITREASATLVGDKAVITRLVEDQLARISAEYRVAEPNLAIQFTPTDNIEHVIGLDATQKVVDVLTIIPNGVLRMSDSFVGVVETSISMGVVILDKGQFNVKCLMRSLAETPKEAVSQQLNALARQTGMCLELSDDYPGWQPAIDSWLLTATKPLMQQVFGNAPQVEVIHAGLECGILSGKNPKLDMISFGPNIRAAHSPKERVEIASVGKTWQVLLALLQQIPKS